MAGVEGEQDHVTTEVGERKLSTSSTTNQSTAADSELAAFKKVAAQAVQEHGDLKKKYARLMHKFQESEKLRKITEKKMQESDNVFKHLSAVSEAACEEYCDLNVRYEVEQQCRLTAETYATKMVKENKDIKRKSAAFLSRAGEDLVRQFELSLEDDEEEETENGVDPQQVKELNARMEDLKEQLIATKRDLEQVALERDEARDDVIGISQQGKHFADQLILEKHSHEATKTAYDSEKMAHESLKMAHEEKSQTIAQFRRVSTVVFQELFEVKGKYEEEAMLREKAENFAALMYKEKQTADAHKRQSMLMLNETIGPDEKMEEVMNEVEQLTKKLADEKQKHEKEIAQLEGKLREAQDVEHMDSLETKLSIAREENEALERKIIEQEPNFRKLQDKINEQDMTIKKLMAELDKAMLKPVAPPPPPPPPPPPVPHSPLEVLRKIIGGRRAAKGTPSTITELDEGKTEKTGDPHQKQYEATIDEMMNRIKSGRVKLKPVQTEEKTLLNRKGPGSIKKMSPAMSQLNGMLTVLKKTGSQGGATGGSDGSGKGAPSSELLAIMQKRRMRSEVPAVAVAVAEPTESQPENQGDDQTGVTNLPEKQNGSATKSKKKPPVPVPRASPTKLTKSTSLDSGMTTEETTFKKDRSDTASVKTCPEMSIAEEDAYSELAPDLDKKSEMSYSESEPSFKGSASEISSEYSEKDSDISSNKESGELEDILLHANPAYESVESIPFYEEGLQHEEVDSGEYETLRIGVLANTQSAETLPSPVN